MLTTPPSPSSITPSSPPTCSGKRVEVADVGCGFGGLLVGLGPILPDTLCLGMEIRSRVTEYVRLRVLALRNGVPPEPESAYANDPALAAVGIGSASSGAAAAAADGSSSSSSSSSSAAAAPTTGPRPFDNVSVIKTNAMKYLPAFFHKGQLTKLFFCFPDPHFKKSNHRRRIVSTPLLAEYAHVLRPGGRLYTISDVRDLHNWMAAHGDAHPAFRRLTDEELAADPCVAVMRTYTEEGKKVERARGDKHVAVFERLDDAAAATRADELAADFWEEPPVNYMYEPAPAQDGNAKARAAAAARAASAAAAAAAAGAAAGAGAAASSSAPAAAAAAATT
jgi:tRNA (guanine-N7-)-methyltransferase